MMSPKEIAVHRMLAKDNFSQWLGITILEVSSGYSKIKMQVRSEMLNGFSITHGGISFSFADSAFAFASNSRGYVAYSVSTDINHLQKVLEGDFLFAEAKEEFYNGKIGKYRVEVTNQDKEVVAIFNGLVYVSKREWV